MTDFPLGEGGILITGAGGVIGSALAEELTAHAHGPVLAVTSKDCNLMKFDDTVALFMKVRPAVVYHLAATVSGIMGNIRAQGKAFLDNILINTHVIEASRLAGVGKIIAMGSAAAYPDNLPLPMREEDIWTGPPHHSEAGYGHAKRAMLAQLEAYKDQYGLDYAYCISTNLFGPHDRFDEHHGHVLPSLISKFHRAASEGTGVTVWGSGTPERDFLFSKDAAFAMRLIGEQFSGVINLATGDPISIFDTVSLLNKLVDPSIPINWDRTKPDGQKLRSYDVSKLKNIGFSTKFTFAEALLQTYAWYSNNMATARR